MDPTDQLLDSNILLRLVHRDHPEHALVRGAVRRLYERGGRGYFTSQNLGEFWNVTTRPATSRGGLGRSLAAADHAAHVVERIVTLMPDIPAVHVESRRLLVVYAIRGVQVHDARLVAAMKVYGLTHVMTFNTKDFARYTEITAAHPQDV